MRELVDKYFNNYYNLYVLLAIVSFVGFTKGSSIENMLSTIFVVAYLITRKVRFKYCDILFLTFFFYQIVSLAFSSYPVYFWYVSVKSQIIPMMFYFIGRYMKKGELEMVSRMKVPMVFAMIVGLILYFWSPGWYIEKRLSGLSANASVTTIYESTRLSSFWPWSYAMGYGALFYIMYHMKELFEDKVKLTNIVCIVIAFLVLFFAQQRVSIAFFMVFLGLVTFFNPYNNRKRVLFIWIFLIAVSSLVFYILINHMDSELLDYIKKRSVDNDDDLVGDRFGMYSYFLKVSLLGDGMGRYGHSAFYLTGKGVTDCEYIRILAELGIVGCAFLAMIFIKALRIGYSYIKTYFFEFCVVAFYLAAMIGATPFENYSMQPFLFWFCVGRIFNSELRDNKHKSAHIISRLNNDCANHSEL